uniref:Cornichon n=1 Tax=Echinococcus granulosus TaxID=6210 RepID=A0A068WVE4_ECHGR|nr:cornichon [Echinococcus granulosus]
MGFGLVAVTYIVALLLTIVLIFFVIYHIIAFDELKTDYKNPVDQCRNLNPLVLPEYCLHAFITLSFLLTWQIAALLVNIPLLVYHIHRYLTRPVKSGIGLYHPTSILNSNELNRAMKEGWVKLAFYVMSFFGYLFGVSALDFARGDILVTCCLLLYTSLRNKLWLSQLCTLL